VENVYAANDVQYDIPSLESYRMEITLSLLHRVGLYVCSDVSEEGTTSVFRVTVGLM